ncbi:YARHG domain-containing protein [Phreatobacter aquaticus]|uniref:YARHG domain-containing protein n=2 Tax=Phreatobacter aquaticus TaxID=2570229 RepID=A0A4D7QTE1_9HYPH|nr:YARHG domain-containing protein [Phreatobacter aquaticus]
MAVAGVLLAASIGSAAAQDFSGWSCRDLWIERNQIYKNAGYCFRTQRAVTYFGNAGCVYDRQGDVPLSARQRQVIADITRAERYLGCTD